MSKETKPTISMLIPHYNDPEGLLMTLRSVEKQTWRGKRHIIVCDDGSKPEHQERLDAVVEETSELVTLIRNAENRGRPYTRNVLLDAADGKYLTWCDAGDEILPKKFEMQLKALHRARLLKFEKTVWSTCNYAIQWQGRDRPKAGHQTVDGDQMNNLLLSTLRAYLFTLLGPTQSFRDVGYFDLKLTRLQDLDFFLRFVSKGGMFILPDSNEPLCLYHKSDVGKAGAEVLRCFQYLYGKHAGIMMSRSRKFRRQRMFELYWHAARFTNNNEERARTGLYLTRSALYNPVSFTRKMIRNKGRL